jgi:hypothetical protein
MGNSEIGSIWTWTAIDADTKLEPSFLIGTRDFGSAFTFVSDLASRLRNRVLPTTDGHKPCLSVVEDVLGWDIDYAVLGGSTAPTRLARSGTVQRSALEHSAAPQPEERIPGTS